MADNVGNRLGPRAYFNYTTDDDETFMVLLDESVATALGNTKSTIPLTVIQRTQKRPYILRTVIVEDPVSDARKEVVIGDPDSPFMEQDVAVNVSINGVAYNVIGRKGEQKFFPSVSAGGGGS